MEQEGAATVSRYTAAGDKMHTCCKDCCVQNEIRLRLDLLLNNIFIKTRAVLNSELHRLN